MFSYQKIIFIFLHLIQIYLFSSASQHSGHLKPFGSSGPFEQIDQTDKRFPNPILFFKNYVSKSRPIVFRQVLADDSLLLLWNDDEQLNELFFDNKDIVHVETRKKENRQQNILEMTMTEFLQRYQNEELYLVEEVPSLLRPYFILPDCLQCKPAFDTFQVAMLWFSSGNTSSVIHTDDYDNINCVLQGEKKFILIDPHKHDKIIDNYSGSYSSIDVDQVDYDKYKSLDHDNISYYPVTLQKGDCLYLPALWIHQVRSTDRNVAVNYWLNHDRVRKAIVDKNTCNSLNQSEFVTLATVDWPNEPTNYEYLKNFMLDLVDDDKTTLKVWIKEFSKEFAFDLISNVRTVTLFAQFFNTIDTNENGFITASEVDNLFETNNLQVAYGLLQNILDIVEIKTGSTNGFNDTTTDDDEEEEEDDDSEYELKRTDL